MTSGQNGPFIQATELYFLMSTVKKLRRGFPKVTLHKYMHSLRLLCLLANVRGMLEAPHTKGRDRGEAGTQPEHVRVHCPLIATYCEFLLFCPLSPFMWLEMVPKLLELQMGGGHLKKEPPRLGRGSPWFYLILPSSLCD